MEAKSRIPGATMIRHAHPKRGIYLAFLCALVSGAAGNGAMAVQEELFALARVTVRVAEQDGTPIEGAEVVAYSDSWRFSLPVGPEFLNTNGVGEASIFLPKGRWVFRGGGDSTLPRAWLRTDRTDRTSDAAAMRPRARRRSPWPVVRGH